MLGLGFALGVAMAADEPDLKEGYWTVHTQTITNPGNRKAEGSYGICRNHAFDQMIRARAKAQKTCAFTTKSLGPGKFSSSSHCTVAGTTMDSNGTTTYTADTATHSESRVTYSPANTGISDITLIMDQKYTGGCPAGMKAGDRKNNDGTIVHLAGKQ